jgi:prevent-host-death family protein
VHELSEKVRPISYLKAHALEVIRALEADQAPMIITLHSERAKAVLQDIGSYEQTQETLALRKILALSNRDVETGAVSTVRKASARVRERVKT